MNDDSDDSEKDYDYEPPEDNSSESELSSDSMESENDSEESEYHNYLESLQEDIEKEEKSSLFDTLLKGFAQAKDDKKVNKIIIVSDKKYPLRQNKQKILSTVEQKKIEKVEKDLWELNRHDRPPRHKVLLADIPLSSKDKIIRNMDRVENMNAYSSEYSKLNLWIDSILNVPFGKYYELPITITSPKEEITSYLANIEKVMDDCIYGQKTAKQKILEFVGKWITNPNSTNEPLAFIGKKGTGKTTLAKEGIAKALGRPFYMISLGGESDAASFKGHDYTYEGSKWGKIVDILISTKCMNPVILFDELDKLSTTRAGEEIEGMLMHLTDTTQNDRFTDKYFSGIEFDLSKALFIFSYNDPLKLNPILRDRLTEINFDAFKKKEKIIIAKDFLIDRACKNIGLKPDNFILSDDVLAMIIDRYTPRESSGVRALKRVIETLFLRINLFQLPHSLNISYKDMDFKKKDGRYVITEKVVSKLLSDMSTNMSDNIYSMYL
jgi:ATP-dependent Lon protease